VAPAYAPPAAPPAPAVAPPQRPSTHPVAADPDYVDPHAPRSLAGFLVSYEGNELGVFYPIYQGQNLVGRKGAAQGLNIELEHGTTSSRHATLFASARPGRVKIEDMGSTNGTFVGDLMLERGKKHELKDGDVVRFGGYVTIIKIV
jgi:pSer/pThr/pTyr-binding forkhead associated (FHA) protein